MLNNSKFTVLISLLHLLSLSAAHGQTTLNLYGQGHLSFDNVDDGTDTTTHIASSSSRFGVTGNYAISDSLKVIFQYESGVDLTGEGENDGNGDAVSGGQIFTKTRPSYLGLEGTFGKVLLGHWNALDQWANDHNLFADQIGDLGNLWEGSGIPGRLDDVIFYETPDLNGFNVGVTFRPDEEAEDDSILIVKSNYTLKNLKLGFAYTNIQQGIQVSDDHVGIAFVGGYYAEGYSVSAGYQTEQAIGGVSGNDRDSYVFGGSLNVGKSGKIKGQYAVSNSDNVDADATQIAIGYDYTLDENNTVYIAYARMENDANINFSVNGKGHGDKIIPAIGNDMNAISVGIVSKFDVSLDSLFR